MVNFNGKIISDDLDYLNHDNRGLLYGDALFESLRVVNGLVYFLEDHYLRLMASMRILRMEIPMEFTMEFMEKEILKAIDTSVAKGAFRVRFTVFRNNGGLYTPETNNVSYIIKAKGIRENFYVLKEGSYEVELFKDFYVHNSMLSNLKTNNRVLNVVGSIFAKENDYDNCLLLNEEKNVVEALNGNLFVINGTEIKTPPLSDGCLDGVLRKNLIAIISKGENYQLVEQSISPFELQKADEIFITNAISGIIPVTKYRKKEYTKKVSQSLIGKLNMAVRISV